MTEDSVVAAMAHVDQIRAAYDDVLDNILAAVTDGLDKKISDARILSALMVDMADNPQISREKAIGLLSVAALRMGRALHEGDYA